MDSSSIQLSGSQVHSFSLEHGILRVHFSRAYIVKTMTGSQERTRWWQCGDLIMEGATPQRDLPVGPLTCSGGDIEDNIYTYRDMIPLPLDSRGHVSCNLGFQGTDTRLIVAGETLRLEMADVPKYIEHIKPAND